MVALSTPWKTSFLSLWAFACVVHSNHAAAANVAKDAGSADPARLRAPLVKLERGILDLSDPPSNIPSDQPSIVPSDLPSTIPSDTPSNMPSDIPSNIPSDQPSIVPSDLPSTIPSDTPSNIPSDIPSIIPSDAPSLVPSDEPSLIPSDEPSLIPSDAPSFVPSDAPSVVPSQYNLECPCFTIEDLQQIQPRKDSDLLHEFCHFDFSDFSYKVSVEGDAIDGGPFGIRLVWNDCIVSTQGDDGQVLEQKTQDLGLNCWPLVFEYCKAAGYSLDRFVDDDRLFGGTDDSNETSDIPSDIPSLAPSLSPEDTGDEVLVVGRGGGIQEKVEDSDGGIEEDEECSCFTLEDLQEIQPVEESENLYSGLCRFDYSMFNYEVWLEGDVPGTGPVGIRLLWNKCIVSTLREDGTRQDQETLWPGAACWSLVGDFCDSVGLPLDSLVDEDKE